MPTDHPLASAVAGSHIWPHFLQFTWVLESEGKTRNAMTAIQKADPAARRRALLILSVGALLAGLLTFGLEHYREPLLDWLLSEPEQSLHRLKLIVLLVCVLLSAPLLAFALYLWSFGGRVMGARRFPLPGQRVIRDTPIVEDLAAVRWGQHLRVLAIILGLAGVVSCWLFWRLVSVLSVQ